MLKFIKNHMATIVDIDIYPVISFLLFFSIFVLVLVYVFSAKKEYMNEMAALPIEPDDSNNQ